MEIDAVFVVGPQGSGKGTQARLLSERLGFYFWENGAILRSVAQESTDIGKKTKELLETGNLLSDEFLLSIVEGKLHALPKDRGIVFDGLPRRVSQAEFIIDLLGKLGKNKLVTVFIDVPKEECLKRLMHRADVEHRADDFKGAIEVRLNAFEKETKPAIQYLKENTTFITIDGQPPIEAVTAQIDHALQVS